MFGGCVCTRSVYSRQYACECSNLLFAALVVVGGALDEAGSVLLVNLLRVGKQIYSILYGHVCHACCTIHAEKKKTQINHIFYNQ